MKNEKCDNGDESFFHPARDCKLLKNRACASNRFYNLAEHTLGLLGVFDDILGKDLRNFECFLIKILRGCFHDLESTLFVFFLKNQLILCQLLPSLIS